MLPLDKSYILNPIFHWEYLREVQMKEKQEKPMQDIKKKLKNNIEGLIVKFKK